MVAETGQTPRMPNSLSGAVMNVKNSNNASRRSSDWAAAYGSILSAYARRRSRRTALIFQVTTRRNELTA